MTSRQLGALVALALAMTACDLAGDLVEIGFWLAIAIIIAVFLAIGWVWRRIRGRGRT